MELNKAAGISAALSGLPDGGNAAINAMSEKLNSASGTTWGSDEFRMYRNTSNVVSCLLVYFVDLFQDVFTR